MKLLRAKFAKNSCCKKQKSYTAEQIFEDFKLRRRRTTNAHLILFIFCFPSRKNVMQKPLCCIPPNIFAPWTQEIMKIMDADGDGVITTNELNQLKVDLYGMG